MATSEALRTQRYYLPTNNLWETDTKFGNITPAFNNNYDVSINLNGQGLGGLRQFINQHGFYDTRGGNYNPGSYLSLFCSEAVLPGSQIQSSQVDGLRQGVSQKFATFRRFPDVILTWYSQKDYYTNDVFNAWMEYISPTRIANGSFGTNTGDRKLKAAFKRMKYPDSYKCSMEITAFSRDHVDNTSRLNRSTKWNQQHPSSITYYLANVFPSDIVAAPLAYGPPELVKTTITFKYDYYYIDRTSRIGPILQESDSPGSGNIRSIPATSFSGGGATSPATVQQRNEGSSDDGWTTWSPGHNLDGSVDPDSDHWYKFDVDGDGVPD